MIHERVFRRQVRFRLAGFTALMLLAVVLGEAQAMGQAGKGPAKDAHRLQTVGLYIQPSAEGDLHFYDFFKACGYNYLEFVEAGFSKRPDLLPKYYIDMARSIEAAHRKGFKVWILLLAGMQQWKGPADAGG